MSAGSEGGTLKSTLLSDWEGTAREDVVVLVLVGITAAIGGVGFTRIMALLMALISFWTKNQPVTQSRGPQYLQLLISLAGGVGRLY